MPPPKFGLALSFQVLDLSADHPIHGAGSAGNLFDDAHARFCRALQSGQNFIRLCLQCVASQDGQGFAKNHMAGRLAPAQIVIIERR